MQGENKINFTAGAQEGTITIEGALGQGLKFDKQLTYADFHPTVEGIEFGASPKAEGKPISLAFPVKTPGDITRLRVSDHFSSMAADTQFVIDVSFDDGKTWKTVNTPTAADFAGKPRFFIGRYCIVTDVPAGTRAALVRYRGLGKGTLVLNNARIDADYKEPAGGLPSRAGHLRLDGRRGREARRPRCQVARGVLHDQVRRDARDEEPDPGAGEVTVSIASRT